VPRREGAEKDQGQQEEETTPTIRFDNAAPKERRDAARGRAKQSQSLYVCVLFRLAL